jgi:branched-chain amino acid transport system ATP-binding protein
MFGFWGFPSFGKTNVPGDIPFPCPGEQAAWGHAIVAVGYDDSRKIKNNVCNKETTGALLIRNSWGTEWGEKGYGWLPYEYVLKGLAEDFWALKDVSFELHWGEAVGIIGRNGAGKSTTLRATSGLLKPRQGFIRLGDEDLTRYPPHEIVAKGVVQVPEGRRVFGRLTVTENLEMGAYTRDDPDEIEQSMQRVFSSFPRLKERIDQLGGTLSGGEQQRVAVARALQVLNVYRRKRHLKPAGIAELNEAGHELANVLAEEVSDLADRVAAEEQNA